jgi:hypothetical protein
VGKPAGLSAYPTDRVLGDGRVGRRSLEVGLCAASRRRMQRSQLRWQHRSDRETGRAAVAFATRDGASRRCSRIGASVPVEGRRRTSSDVGGAWSAQAAAPRSDRRNGLVDVSRHIARRARAPLGERAGCSGRAEVLAPGCRGSRPSVGGRFSFALEAVALRAQSLRWQHRRDLR